jgi:hypothetical protein
VSRRALIGVIAFAALIALTIVEWLGALYAATPMLVLAPVVAAKALIILVWFMHIRELRNPEDEH